MAISQARGFLFPQYPISRNDESVIPTNGGSDGANGITFRRSGQKANESVRNIGTGIQMECRDIVGNFPSSQVPTVDNFPPPESRGVTRGAISGADAAQLSGRALHSLISGARFTHEEHLRAAKLAKPLDGLINVALSLTAKNGISACA